MWKSSGTLQLRMIEHVYKWLHNLLAFSAPINVRTRKSCFMNAKHINETSHKFGLKTAFDPYIEMVINAFVTLWKPRLVINLDPLNTIKK